MHQKCFPIIILFMLPFAGKSQMECLNMINIALGPEGTATIRPIDLLASSPNSTSTYSVSKSNFTCADIGAPQTVTLYELREGISFDTCFIIVNVEDKLIIPVCAPPSLACWDTVNIALGADGTATISPADLLASSAEPSYVYTVSPSYFDCSNIGENKVTLTVTTSAGVLNQCISTVFVEDKRPGPPPCFPLVFARIRFIPDNLWLNPVPPLTFVPFEATLASEVTIKSAKADFVFVISNDTYFDSNDIIVHQSPIKAKNKESEINVSGKFQIPQNIQLGKYFLLADVFSNSKKLDIGLKPFILPIEIGYGTQIVIPKNYLSNTKQLVYPNPFTNKLNINLELAPVSSVEIFNFTGKLVRSRNYKYSNSLHFEIDLSDLIEGSYYLKIKDKEGNIFNKTVVKN